MKHHANAKVQAALPIEEDISSTISPPRPWIKFQRSVEQMAEAMKRVPRPAHWGVRRSDLVWGSIPTMGFASADNAIEFAIAYMECALSVSRYSVYDELKPAYVEMRSWLPYCVHSYSEGKRILLNREYKPVGSTDKKTFVNYADFEHVHVDMDEDSRNSLAGEGCRSGFLYKDGISPYWGRKEAEGYLAQLRKLKGLVLSA
jgi:hypothetical protein